MGQKVNPIGLRIGIIRGWESKWYAGKDYADLLHEDIKIRKYLFAQLKDAAIPRIEIERAAQRVNVTIHSAKPGIIIGRGGSDIEGIKNALIKLTGKRVNVNIVEIKKADLEAQLVAENIAKQLENRVSFRRAQKQSIQRTMRAGAKGIKTMVSGRLGGADIARSEHYSEGTVPLHTLRADIDYGFAEADTTYGKLGVKVWIYKGDVLSAREVEEAGRVKS